MCVCVTITPSVQLEMCGYVSEVVCSDLTRSRVSGSARVLRSLAMCPHLQPQEKRVFNGYRLQGGIANGGICNLVVNCTHESCWSPWSAVPMVQ